MAESAVLVSTWVFYRVGALQDHHTGSNPDSVLALVPSESANIARVERICTAQISLSWHAWSSSHQQTVRYDPSYQLMHL